MGEPPVIVLGMHRSGSSMIVRAPKSGIKSIASMIDSERKFAFTTPDELVQLYNETRDLEMIQELNYHSIL